MVLDPSTLPKAPASPDGGPLGPGSPKAAGLSAVRCTLWSWVGLAFLAHL